MTQTAAQYASELILRTKQFPGTLLTEFASSITNDIKRLEEESKYNGWANYETWLVDLHLNNDQGTQEAVKELLAQDYEYPTIDRIDALKEFVEEIANPYQNPDLESIINPNLFAQDLINATLASVNWQEIIDGFREQ